MKLYHRDNKEILHSNVLEHHVIASISPDLSKYVEAVPSHDPLMLTCLMDGRTSMSKGTSAKYPWPYSLPHLPKIWNSAKPILQCNHKEPNKPYNLKAIQTTTQWWGNRGTLQTSKLIDPQTYSQNTEVKCWPPTVAKQYLNTFSVHLTFRHLFFYTALTIKECRPLTTLRYKY